MVKTFKNTKKQKCYRTCPQIYDDEAEMPAAETQLDGIINQYCSMISNIINLKNDQLNSMVAQLRQFVLKKMVFQLASIWLFFSNEWFFVFVKYF